MTENERFTRHYLNTIFTEVTAIHTYCEDNHDRMSWSELENCNSRVISLIQVMNSISCKLIKEDETLKHLLSVMRSLSESGWKMQRQITSWRDASK